MEDPIWVEQKFRSSTESLMSVWCSVVAFGQGRPSIKALFSHEAQWMTLCQSFSFALSKSQSHELCNNMEWYELVLFSQLLVEGLECSIKKSTRNASICMYQPLMIVMKQPFCSVPSSQSCIPPPPPSSLLSLYPENCFYTLSCFSLSSQGSAICPAQKSWEWDRLLVCERSPFGIIRFAISVMNINMRTDQTICPLKIHKLVDKGCPGAVRSVAMFAQWKMYS